ncbi:ADP-ribosylglycohydrolase family protein [bacterium]|nr:ADP-ribosylglycohydrolase family protein [bacterium]
MLPSPEQLSKMIADVLADKERQGHDISGMNERLEAAGTSYDALMAVARYAAGLPLRKDWPYHEPNDLAGILDAADTQRPTKPLAEPDAAAIAPRIEAAFLGSVCGCILGKPLEVNPTLAEIRAAAEPLGEWPLRDYVSSAMLDALGRRHNSWPATTSGNIRYAASDDDINYTVTGMLVQERKGYAFTMDDLADIWQSNLPINWTWGPERLFNIKNGIRSYFGWNLPRAFEEWVSLLQPGDELCGAVIRADAYGYSCPGNPALAAELAWRDAAMTHRRTGIYATMYVAAAIATAMACDDPLEVFRIAQQFVPQRSRFFAIVSDSLEHVRAAADWLDGYNRIHGKYGQYGHCQVYQETGTLINTLCFARDVGDGICMQVAQGNDTDSFGATAGSLLGAFFGPGHLDDRWLAPFNDTIHLGMADEHEQSLSRLAKRMGRLPAVARRR